jgi:hypothetical protein
MHEFFMWLANSPPASVLNVFLNIVQIAVTAWAVWIIIRYKNRVNAIVTDGTKWLVQEAVKANQEEHLTRLYQRVDALATSIGKEFLCNPEHLIPHRGMADNKD